MNLRRDRKGSDVEFLLEIEKLGHLEQRHVVVVVVVAAAVVDVVVVVQINSASVSLSFKK